MNEKAQELEELEELAKEFIIGYEPWTIKQKEILCDIYRVEHEIIEKEKELARLKRIHSLLYQKLADISSK